jgi:cholestenol delta-isomerase
MVDDVSRRTFSGEPRSSRIPVGPYSLSMMTSENILHPYYPVDAPIFEYVPNEASLLNLLTTAIIGTATLLGTAYTLASVLRPNLSKADRIAILWFFLCRALSMFEPLM